jgi:type IV pilus assembly protein PilA
MDLFFTLLIFIIFGSIFIGIPYSIYRSIKRKKKALTVSLIIFSCIIIFCVWLVETWEGGYMKQAKIESTKTNHSNNKSFIAAVLTKCSSGSSKVSINNVDVDCTEDKLKPAFIAYFKDINKNPYDNTVASMLEGGGTPALGQSFLAVDGKKYTLKTNIGNEDGSDVYLKDTIVSK